MASALEPWLAGRSGGVARETAVLKIAGLPESVVEERIAPAYEEFGREAITILANVGEIRLQATAAGPEAERRARLAAMVARLAGARRRRRLHHPRGGHAGERRRRPAARRRGHPDRRRIVHRRPLLAADHRRAGEQRLLPGRRGHLQQRAEDAAGGRAAEAMLAEHGAVSEPVARAMAEGVRRALGSDWGVGITGVAGPGGGSEAKPVGTVHLAVAGPADGEVEHRAGPPARRPRPGAPVLGPDRPRDAAPAPAGGGCGRRREHRQG